MNEQELQAALKELLSAYVDVPSDALARLDLDSLSTVRFIEDLEDRFGLTVRASEATPQNFGSFAALTAFVKGKQA